MKTRYRIIARRPVIGEKRVRLRDTRRAVEPTMDDPFEMTTDVIDLVTGTVVPGARVPQTRRKR